ncbi:response regulator [Caenimonas aquaedulcis]|uniref:Response regulator n=1 Tax=Caenimonas aquaedulcis TaxID=2793270 RepID=A0A931H950_9BURK|nr:response regulator [Caenimonas aquaedulcis]MBG9390623.1 response regulator [Caenimonas aquaedulcis]
MKILLVEDDEDQVLLTCTALEATGLKTITIEHVESGRACLEYFEESAPGASPADLVLLDLNMPGMSGFDVLKERLARPQMKSVPVVMLTTSKSPSDVRRCYELGCNTFMAKPVDFEVLVNSLRQLVEYWTRLAILPVPSR